MSAPQSTFEELKKFYDEPGNVEPRRQLQQAAIRDLQRKAAAEKFEVKDGEVGSVAQGERNRRRARMLMEPPFSKSSAFGVLKRRRVDPLPRDELPADLTVRQLLRDNIDPFALTEEQMQALHDDIDAQHEEIKAEERFQDAAAGRGMTGEDYLFHGELKMGVEPESESE